MCTLCVRCPQKCFLLARHKGDPRRGHFAWQHILKVEARQLFFLVVVITIIVSWVSPTKKCCVVQMPPIISHQCPAILKWQRLALAHYTVIVTVLDAGACILREIDMVVFSPRMCAAIAAALSL